MAELADSWPLAVTIAFISKNDALTTDEKSQDDDSVDLVDSVIRGA